MFIGGCAGSTTCGIKIFRLQILFLFLKNQIKKLIYPNSIFVVSYIIVTRNIAEIPPSSTIAISALFFLLGLAGLSFGILSASWDKEPGSFFGIENIPMNIQRAKAAFKPATQNFDENS